MWQCDCENDDNVNENVDDKQEAGMMLTAMVVKKSAIIITNLTQQGTGSAQNKFQKKIGLLGPGGPGIHQNEYKTQNKKVAVVSANGYKFVILASAGFQDLENRIPRSK